MSNLIRLAHVNGIFMFIWQKLKAIDELKEQQTAGKVMQKNQVIQQSSSAWLKVIYYYYYHINIIIVSLFLTAWEDAERASAVKRAWRPWIRIVNSLYQLSHCSSVSKPCLLSWICIKMIFFHELLTINK